jgi:hypothetical protein
MMMKVKELIAKLKKYNNEDDEIIVAYWAKDDVSGWYEDGISDKKWKKLVDRFDYYDFQQVCDDMDDIFCNDIMEEINEEKNL